MTPDEPRMDVVLRVLAEELARKENTIKALLLATEGHTIRVPNVDACRDHLTIYTEQDYFADVTIFRLVNER
jgi:hypothetical protein